MNVQRKAMIPGGLAAGGPVLAGEPLLAGPLHPLAESLNEAVGQHWAGGRRVERPPAEQMRNLMRYEMLSV